MINIKDKCATCVHHEVCGNTEDYIEVGNRLSEYSNRFDGEIIAEGVAQIELTCKYYKPIASTPKSIDADELFDLR